MKTPWRSPAVRPVHCPEREASAEIERDAWFLGSLRIPRGVKLRVLPLLAPAHACILLVQGGCQVCRQPSDVGVLDACMRKNVARLAHRLTRVAYSPEGVLAYLAHRYPGTFAANLRVLTEVCFHSIWIR